MLIESITLGSAISAVLSEKQRRAAAIREQTALVTTATTPENYSQRRWRKAMLDVTNAVLSPVRLLDYGIEQTVHSMESAIGVNKTPHYAEKKKWFLRVAGAAALAGGTALMFTGVGTPAAMALTSAGMATLTTDLMTNKIYAESNNNAGPGLLTRIADGVGVSAARVPAPVPVVVT